MKHQYFRSLTRLLLILGLCSCNSDNTQNGEDSQNHLEVKSVSYVHTDKSLHDINDTKELSIDSSIQLSLSSSPENNFVLTSNSFCFGASLEENTFHSQYWKNQKSIPVKDLLPIQTLKPLQSEENQIICDFKLEIKNEFGSKTTIDLKDIQITNLFDYYDINPLNNNTSKASHYILEEELKKEIPFPFQDGIIFLVCEDQYSSFNMNNSSFSFQKIKDYQFLNKENNYCRFVFEDKLSKSRQIGRNFYLQKKSSKIRLSLTPQLPDAEGSTQNPFLRFNQQGLPLLNIHNDGDTKAYIDLQSISDSQIELLGLFAIEKPTKIGTHHSALIQSIHWVPIQKEFISHNNKTFIPIEAHQTIQFEATTTGSMQCHGGPLATTHNYDTCHTQSFFRGYFIALHYMPMVKVSKSTSLEGTKWQTYSATNTLPPLKNIGAWRYHYWKASPLVPAVCQDSLKTTASFPDTLKRVKVSTNNFYECRIN